MNEKRRKWFLFSPGDAAGVRAMLNELARRGWELAETQDSCCLTATFCPTQRTELRYDVVPALPLRSPERIKRTVQSRAQAGWESMATINGMDIYRTMPCKRATAMAGEHSKRVLRRALAVRWLPLMVFGVLAAFLAALELRSVAGSWYTGNWTVLLWYSAAPLAAVGLYALLWSVFRLIFPGEKPKHGAMMFRGVLKALFDLWAVLALVTGLWDALPQMIWRVAILVATGGPVLYGTFRWGKEHRLLARRFSAMIIAAAILATIGLHMALPDGSYTGAARISTNRPVVTGEAVGLTNGTLEYVQLEQSDSLLVQETRYQEYWEDGTSLASTVDRCRTGSLADRIEAQRHREAAGSTDEACFRYGKTVVWVAGSIDWSDPSVQQAVKAALEKTLGTL